MSLWCWGTGWKFWPQRMRLSRLDFRLRICTAGKPRLGNGTNRYATRLARSRMFTFVPLRRRNVVCNEWARGRAIFMWWGAALDLADGHWKMVGPIASKMRRYRKAGKIGAAATVLLHPSGGSEEEEYRRATLMIGALRKQQVLLEHVVGPNNDPGHEGILAAYRDAEIGVEMSMSQEAFWTRMATSSFLIGNSSSGIIEAASFGIPVINLGERQKGRERNLNVLDVPWKGGERGIEAAMRRALGDGVFLGKVAKRRNLYGDGHAAARVVKVLESLRFPLATTKQFHDS